MTKPEANNPINFPVLIARRGVLRILLVQESSTPCLISVYGTLVDAVRPRLAGPTAVLTHTLIIVHCNGAPTRDCSLELDHSDSRPNYILNSLGDPTASRGSTRSGLCISSSVIST